MRGDMKHKIFPILLCVWIVLWIGFTARELFVKDSVRDYRALLSRTLEGKRSYVTGDRLYEFLMFCKEKAPQGATYAIAGLDDGSIEKRRAAYYLYPLLESREPDLIFVFDKPDAGQAGYGVFAGLDGSRYILKKAK